MTTGSLMKVESIAVKPMFCLFESGYFTQVLLYKIKFLLLRLIAIFYRILNCITPFKEIIITLIRHQAVVPLLWSKNLGL